MAKFTAGVGFGQASGSVAGVTYSRNRFGVYMRAKAVPVNPASTKQNIVRGRLGNLAQSWRALTNSQRLEWNTQAPNITLVNSLGQTYTPSGFNFYVGLNCVRVAAGLAVATGPLAQQTQAVITAFSFTAVGATGVVTLTFAPAIAASSFYLVRATAPQSPGTVYFARGKFKDLGFMATADVSPFALTALYAAAFGSLVAGDVGKRIAIRLIPISSNGFQGTATEATALVT